MAGGRLFIYGPVCFGSPAHLRAATPLGFSSHPGGSLLAVMASCASWIISLGGLLRNGLLV